MILGQGSKQKTESSTVSDYSLKTAFKMSQACFPESYHLLYINLSIFNLNFFGLQSYIKRWSPFSFLNHHIF